jgi:exosortase/archaeosortase
MSFGEQKTSALIFVVLSAYFGYQAVSTLRLHLREKKTDTAASEMKGLPHISFIPHWFVMAALGVTVVIVVGSILWKFMR